MRLFSYIILFLFSTIKFPLIGERFIVLNKKLTTSNRTDSAQVQYISLKDTSVVNFIKKWVIIMEKKDPYFKERGVLSMRFNRSNQPSDTLGFFSLTILYSYKDLVKEQSSMPIFYSLVKKRYVLIEADPILTRSLIISNKSLNEVFKRMKIWFQYPHVFTVPDPSMSGKFTKELIGKAQGDAGDLSLVRSEYTPALIIRKNLPPISTGFSVYGWSK